MRNVVTDFSCKYHHYLMPLTISCYYWMKNKWGLPLKNIARMLSLRKPALVGSGPHPLYGNLSIVFLIVVNQIFEEQETRVSALLVGTLGYPYFLLGLLHSNYAYDV
ncbi:MAG: hypothetical protein ACTS78_01470 [Arsenophonus sp. NC-WZS1-MAG3]